MSRFKRNKRHKILNSIFLKIIVLLFERDVSAINHTIGHSASQRHGFLFNESKRGYMEKIPNLF